MSDGVSVKRSSLSLTKPGYCFNRIHGSIYYLAIWNSDRSLCVYCTHFCLIHLGYWNHCPLLVVLLGNISCISVSSSSILFQTLGESRFCGLYQYNYSLQFLIVYSSGNYLCALARAENDIEFLFQEYDRIVPNVSYLQFNPIQFKPYS